MSVDLKQLVFSNLDAAKEGESFEPGGYLDGYTAEDIALDMVIHASDLEDYESEELVEFIKEWMNERNINPGT